MALLNTLRTWYLMSDLAQAGLLFDAFRMQAALNFVG
jgi:hypothetical protein